MTINLETRVAKFKISSLAYTPVIWMLYSCILFSHIAVSRKGDGGSTQIFGGFDFKDFK